MRTKASRPQVRSIAFPLASLVAVTVIAGSSPAVAGCGALYSYQHTGALRRERFNRGTCRTDGVLRLDGHAKHFVLPVRGQHRHYGARRPRGAAEIHMPGSSLVRHNIVANSQHTNALQMHNSSVRPNKSANRKP